MKELQWQLLLLLQEIGVFIKNIGGNILLFIPLGFFIPLIWRKVNWKRAFYFSVLNK
ncbi:VanZ family protein [Paenibacillus alginolyticus]|uniref:hypothetical protein n=1 Tax=Paenibacillus alginolyticus TaxID=59839 RepID=UPI003908A3DE